MSADTPEQSADPSYRSADLRGPRLVAFGLGIVGLIATVIGAFIVPGATARGYLIGFFFSLGLPIGALGLVLLHHLVGGDWGEVVRGPLEAAMMTIPIAALAFIPLAFMLPTIYPWAEPGAEPDGYLTTGWFLIRAFIYFAVWVGTAFWLYWDSPHYNPGDRTDRAVTVRKASAAGMVAFFLTTTFAYIDWGMSLNPDWISTIYGVMVLVGHILLALSVLLMTVGLMARRADPLNTALTDHRLNDLGNILLVFVALWAYTSFSQYLIIWSGDKLHEIPWYLDRASGGWQHIPPMLIVLQFFGPLIALFFRPFKRNLTALGSLAAITVALRLVDTVWLLAPAFAPSPLAVPWPTYTTVIGLGGLLIGAWLWLIPHRPLFRRDHLGNSTPMETGEVAHVPD